MSQTVTNSTIGVVTSEATQNATKHGPHDRSSVHGVSTSEATANAVTNTSSANE